MTPRPYTAEEARQTFLRSLRALAGYWANLPDLSPQERCDGLVFSFLCTIDGVTTALPALDISLAPHPDDEAFHRREGENWYEAGQVINNAMLHEMLNDIPLPKFITCHHSGCGAGYAADAETAMAAGWTLAEQEGRLIILCPAHSQEVASE